MVCYEVKQFCFQKVRYFSSRVKNGHAAVLIIWNKLYISKYFLMVVRKQKQRQISFRSFVLSTIVKENKNKSNHPHKQDCLTRISHSIHHTRAVSNKLVRT